MKRIFCKNVVGASLAEVMSIIIIIGCSILLLVPQVLKQDDTQLETLILGYERTARKAARDAMYAGIDSLAMNISDQEQVAFVVDSKGKRIYALKEGETLEQLACRLKSHKIERIENYGVKLTLTSDDPWHTRVVNASKEEKILSSQEYRASTIMKMGKTFDLREYILCVSVHKIEDDQFEYYQWWQNARGSRLLEY